jgi:hypothetical protein
MKGSVEQKRSAGNAGGRWEGGWRVKRKKIRREREAVKAKHHDWMITNTSGTIYFV